MRTVSLLGIGVHIHPVSGAQCPLGSSTVLALMKAYWTSKWAARDKEGHKARQGAGCSQGCESTPSPPRIISLDARTPPQPMLSSESLDNEAGKYLMEQKRDFQRESVFSGRCHDMFPQRRE